MTLPTRSRTPMKGPSMSRKFMLDRSNGKLLGVCAGIGNYFGIDPLFARIGFVAATLFFGVPAILYFIIALVAD